MSIAFASRIQSSRSLVRFSIIFFLQELASKHLQSLVKLFALACKSERESRAVEFAHMVTSAKGIQTMIAYATKQKRTLLAEKVGFYVGKRSWVWV